MTLVAGCGDDRPERVPVSGQVLIDGQPLTHGVVRVVPEDSRMAVGEIGSDGRFTLTTFEEGDGAVAGTHAVEVYAAEEIDPSQIKWHAPKKYSRADASGLTITIDEPTDDAVIELEWNGGKPFVEKLDEKGV